MSQQSMEFNQPQNTDERTASYTTGYQQEQGLYLDEYTASSRGQKLSQHRDRTGPTSGQRLALAIVSLSLFVFAFTFAMVMALVIPSDSLKPLSPVMGVFGVGLTVLLIAVNVLFNRKQETGK